MSSFFPERSMKMNIAWHTTHPMPRRATMTQRIRWHREHADECGCRPIPDAVKSAMRSRENSRRRVDAARTSQVQIRT